MIKPSTISPLPIIAQRLAWLLSTGVGVGTVLDVGVQGGTPFLIGCCQSVPHLLFEPVDEYFSAIQSRYASLRSELFRVALSDSTGEAWQLGYSKDAGGRITHSEISDLAVAAGSRPGLVSCKPVPRMRLDDVLADRVDALPYLLKVDVDGHELAILRGAEKTLAHVSVAIVEASVSTVGAKVALLAAAGFDLVDIVDPCYYHSMLSQVDLIFVSRTWITRCPDLRPWQTKTFAWEAWAPLSRNELLAPGLG